MSYLFLALIAIGLAALALRAFLTMDARVLAGVIRKTGGYGLLGAALVLAVMGRFALALPFAAAGMALLRSGLPFPGFPGSSQPRSGQRSTVRSAFITMMLDHDTGRLDGEVIKGRFSGRALSSLELGECLALRAEMGTDEESKALLDTFLEQAFPDWRDAAGAEAGTGGDAGGADAGPARGPMTVEEAREVLGVAPGASSAEIKSAHRALMKQVHPDHGGSTYFASKANEARDLLLGKKKGR